jgi:hypothetical protein
LAGSPPRNATRPGWGRIRSEVNAKAQSRQDATGFFYDETRKPGIIEKISWFPGFLMELFWVAPLRVCVFALKGFCLVARLQRPTMGQKAGTTATPGRDRVQPEFNAKAQSRQDAIGFFFITKPGNQESSKRFHGVLASLEPV